MRRLGAEPLPPPYSPGAEGPLLTVAEMRALGWKLAPDWCIDGLWRVEGLVQWIVTDRAMPRVAGRKAVVPAWVVDILNGLNAQGRVFYETICEHDDQVPHQELDEVLVMHTVALLWEDMELRASVLALVQLGMWDVPLALIEQREPRLHFHGAR